MAPFTAVSNTTVFSPAVRAALLVRWGGGVDCTTFFAALATKQTNSIWGQIVHKGVFYASGGLSPFMSIHIPAFQKGFCARAELCAHRCRYDYDLQF